MRKLSTNKLIRMLRDIYFKRRKENQKQKEAVLCNRDGILVIVSLVKNQLLIKTKEGAIKVL